MTIYEIDSRINDILNAQVDPETGELLEEINFDELESLKMSRDKKIINGMLAYKNMIAEADAIIAEAKKLMDKAKKIQNRANGLYNYMDFCLGGEAFSDPRATARYTWSTTTEVNQDFVKWAQANGHEDLLRCKPKPDPEPEKKKIANALKNAKENDDLLKYAWFERHRKLKIE